MYHGWNDKFKVNRALTSEECHFALPRKHDPNVEADDHGSLIGFNSTYAEFRDKFFSDRGSAGFLIVFCSCVFFAVSIIPIIYFSVTEWAGLLGLIPIAIAGSSVFTMLILKKELFTYTSYPIRINRKTRKIYFFNHNGSGGVTTVPWDEAFFHLGFSRRDKGIVDLRCHILDSDTVRDTYAVGKCYGREFLVNELWQFIWRYMEEGPDSVKPPFVSFTTEPTWTNCVRVCYLRIAVAYKTLQIILFPLVGPVILARWLALKTCKKPQWPAEIERECAVEPDDPYNLQEPNYIGEGFEYNPYEVQREVEKAARHKNLR